MNKKQPILIKPMEDETIEQFKIRVKKILGLSGAGNKRTKTKK